MEIQTNGNICFISGNIKVRRTEQTIEFGPNPTVNDIEYNRTLITSAIGRTYVWVNSLYPESALMNIELTRTNIISWSTLVNARVVVVLAPGEWVMLDDVENFEDAIRITFTRNGAVKPTHIEHISTKKG